jgi:hypothetical protein
VAVLVCAPAVGAQPAKEPVFSVHTAAGKVLQGSLESLGPDWSVRLQGENPAVAGRDLISIRREPAHLPAFPSGLHLILTNGDRFPIEGARDESLRPRLDGERLLFRHPLLAFGEETGVSQGAVSVLCWRIPATADSPEKLLRQLATGRRKDDTLLLTNGDRLEGVLTRLDVSKIELQSSGKNTTVEVAQVAALAWNTDLVESLKPRTTYARIVVAGDRGHEASRFSLKDATLANPQTLDGTTVFGARLRVPLERVLALDIFQGAATYLSDLTPARYEHEPYLDLAWPLVPDASVWGGDLRVGRSTFDKGLGVHPRSRVRYTLDGKYRRFEATVALDPVQGRSGSARVRILADGKPLPLERDGELANPEVLNVSVPVQGVRELTLEVDFGRRGDRQAHVNWADARLVK